jgi:dTDP-glucose 4,6-dehydratase
MGTILVTGGAGFIGSNLVRHLISRAGAAVVTLDKLTYAGNLDNLGEVLSHPGHVFVHGDIADADLVAGLMRQHSVRAVINLAAETHVDRSIHGPAAFIQTNIVGTLNLLKQAHHYWQSLPPADQVGLRFLQVSTDEVYGSLGPSDPAFTEGTTYAPNSPYAASKAGADHLVRAFYHTYGVPTLTTNCSNNYGPYQFPEKLIPLMVLNAIKGESLPIYGDGRNVRDWLYVEDHCKALLRVLEAGRVGETYNVGGNGERTNLDVVGQICDVLDDLRPLPGGGSYRAQIAFVADRPGHDRRYAMNASKLRSELGWRPEVEFETGLRRTVQWYLDHSQWIHAIETQEYRQWLTTNYGSRLTS